MVDKGRGVVVSLVLCVVLVCLLAGCGSSRNLHSASYGRQGNRVYKAPKCNCSYKRDYWQVEDDFVSSRPAVQYQALALETEVGISEE